MQIEFNERKRYVTCGILLHTKDGYLLCHPTGREHGIGCHDIPKGMKEEGETEWQCAVRELREETGLVIPEGSEADAVDLGRHPYNIKKDIHLFYCETEEIDRDSLVCTSMVPRTGKPEVDGYLVTEDLNMCFASLVRVFVRLGLMGERANG